MLIEKLNSFYDMAAVWLVVALGMSTIYNMVINIEFSGTLVLVVK